jgi:hypothetical protein
MRIFFTDAAEAPNLMLAAFFAAACGPLLDLYLPPGLPTLELSTVNVLSSSVAGIG